MAVPVCLSDHSTACAIDNYVRDALRSYPPASRATSPTCLV